MLYLFILSIIKVIDNICMTFKSIAVYQHRKLLASILTVISQLMFYLIIKQIVSDDSISSILVVSVASGVGSYLAFILNDKFFTKDTTWINFITCSDLDDLMKLCNYLRENKIKYQASHGLTRKGKETLNIIALANTRLQSKLIDKYIAETDTRYMREVMKGE